MNTPPLETERLQLRKFVREDIEALHLLLRDEEVNTFLPWFPAKTLAETMDFYRERIAPNYEKTQGYYYAVCLKDRPEPIGYMKVDMDDSHDFGYAFRRDVWRNGFATEAGRAVIAQLKKDGIPYITATHDVNNPRSGGVMRRLGMKYQYSYQEQWQPKNFAVVFRMYQLNIDGQAHQAYRKYWDLYSVHFIESEI